MCPRSPFSLLPVRAFICPEATTWPYEQRCSHLCSLLTFAFFFSLSLCLVPGCLLLPKTRPDAQAALSLSLRRPLCASPHVQRGHTCSTPFRTCTAEGARSWCRASKRRGRQLGKRGLENVRDLCRSFSALCPPVRLQSVSCVVVLSLRFALRA